MTLREFLRKQLTESGLFDHMADAVIERMLVDKIYADDLPGRINDDTEGYPPQLLAVLYHGAKRHALAVIDETLPQAWFRPMFE